ncbi:UDP-N-acetylmuramoyl-tripeptide--D-alanyl-D-alanine ligase [Daejeonella rubra]|uniref:UDP-N-acetylmuramoyl-tripeptide--D-alanyl-D-alanine ligase n=1 Tax=Daejeonella rubra TaxID=990371 RepID=A0A1G9VL69_9SPHI|nr:UDP-N-acetylmuramoyl-tripeptide--D-alanyl-D-alanine ligase [Daejeonella rubra]SDM72847.1 UDP-N-acetylmuramoyl-tripeptide--D-alanyl-D-alanine ligase [Daejeonella rubra]
MTTEQLYQIYLKHPQICTDTRKITDSSLFFALRGDNFDGNKFALQAIENGAAFSVIDNAEYALDDRFILVDDVLETLQNLARLHRKQLKIPVIGITGTNGKTTTKELVKSVLSQQFNTFATEGNLNNHIGVPLSILSVPSDCEIAIIEMGANHQREIAFLCSIAQPSHGMITNVGKAHLEGFGGVEGVKIGKGELYEFLSKTGGIGFINNDNPTLITMAHERGLKNTVGYGKGSTNFLSVRLKNSSPYLSVDWNLPGEPKQMAFSNLPGIYNFDNISAAICIGGYFNLSPEKINKGINAYKPVNNRSQILETPNNTIICDYYNANPSSMMVALENLEDTGAKSKVLILGDMFELGEESAKEHRLILEKALHTKAERRIFVGEEFFRLKGIEDAEFYRNTPEASEALNKRPIKQSTILLKGSRGMKLESLLDLL